MQIQPTYFSEISCGFDSTGNPVWILTIDNLSGLGLGGTWILHMTRTPGDTCPTVAGTWTLVESPFALTSPSVLIENFDDSCPHYTAGVDCPSKCDTGHTPAQFLVTVDLSGLGCGGVTSLDGLDASISKTLTQKVGSPCIWEIIDDPINGTTSTYFTSPCTGATAPGSPYNLTVLLRLTRVDSTTWRLLMQFKRVTDGGLPQDWTDDISVTIFDCESPQSGFSATNIFGPITAVISPV